VTVGRREPIVTFWVSWHPRAQFQKPRSEGKGQMATVLSQPTIARTPGAGSPACSLEDESARIGAGMNIGISSFGAWMIGVSANIGSMAFLFHTCMIAQAGPLASVAAWVIAAAMALPLGLVLAELSSMFPAAGGPYVYKYFALKRLIPGMGEMMGFLTGWIFWIYIIAGYACMSNGLVNLLSASLFGAPQASPLWFGPVVIVGLFGTTTVLNLVRVGAAARINNLFTILKLLVAAAFGVLAVMHPGSSLSNLFNPASPAGGTNFWTNVFCVLPLALAGFSGIEFAGCCASETADARRSVPKAILRTILTVALIYIGMCAAVCIVSPYGLSADKGGAIIPGTTTLATAPSLAGYMGGPVWGFLVTAGVVMSIFSCGFTGLMSGARTSFSMAETGLFPKTFARLNPKTLVPDYGLWFQFAFMSAVGVISYFLAKTGVVPDAYSFLGGTCGFIYGVLALLYGVCLLALRYTDPQMQRPFRIGARGNLIAWVVTLFLTGVYSFVTFGCSHWTHQVAGTALLILGVPIYLYYRRGR